MGRAEVRKASQRLRDRVLRKAGLEGCTMGVEELERRTEIKGRGVGTQDSVTTGLGPQPHAQPPRHFSTYRHL